MAKWQTTFFFFQKIYCAQQVKVHSSVGTNCVRIFEKFGKFWVRFAEVRNFWVRSKSKTALVHSNWLKIGLYVNPVSHLVIAWSYNTCAVCSGQWAVQVGTKNSRWQAKSFVLSISQKLKFFITFNKFSFASWPHPAPRICYRWIFSSTHQL